MCPNNGADGRHTFSSSPRFSLSVFWLNNPVRYRNMHEISQSMRVCGRYGMSSVSLDSVGPCWGPSENDTLSLKSSGKLANIWIWVDRHAIGAWAWHSKRPNNHRMPSQKGYETLNQMDSFIHIFYDVIYGPPLIRSAVVTQPHCPATAATRSLVISSSEDGAGYKFFSIDQGLNPGFLYCFKANNK